MNIEKQELAEDEIDALLMKSKANDLKALTRLYQHFFPKIYSYIYYRLNSVQDAEDLTSEVFVKVVKNLRKQKGSFHAWLFRIASNSITDYYRRRSVRRTATSDENPHEGADSFEEVMEKHFFEQEFKQALTQLTQEQQDVVVLKFVEGYGTSEIAAMLSKSVESVRALQFRALSKLRTLLHTEREKKEGKG